MSKLPNQSIQTYSQALLLELERHFTREQISQLESLLDYCLKQNIAKEAPEIVRPQGASFNPRPARILQIAMREIPCISLVELGALILYCLGSSENCPQPEIWKEERALAIQLECLTSKIPSKSPCSDPRAEQRARLLVLTKALDDIRHLHMTNLNNQQKRKLIAETERQLDSLTTEFQNIMLIKKLVSALNRAQLLCH